ncbi:HD domain-containing protein [Candidatus Leptofilum sp.]|uniref:HD domain-containing protein n=1 Tax=Candidatus Leptofilum sp. TaxID=3241576 RepID=UPI003B5BEE9C
MVRYRLWQFWQVVTAVPLEPAAREEVAAILSASELSLFDQFSPNDQRHSYRVMKMLQDAGHSQPALLVAALLHDVGKTKLHLTIWERSLIVLASILLPRQTAVWGQGEAVGWKRPFVVKVQHPIWSAEMAAAAGSLPQAIELIRRHQDTVPPDDSSEEAKLLRLLQWADDQN